MLLWCREGSSQLIANIHEIQGVSDGRHLRWCMRSANTNNNLQTQHAALKLAALQQMLPQFMPLGLPPLVDRTTYAWAFVGTE